MEVESRSDRIERLKHSNKLWAKCYDLIVAMNAAAGEDRPDDNEDSYLYQDASERLDEEHVAHEVYDLVVARIQQEREELKD